MAGDDTMLIVRGQLDVGQRKGTNHKGQRCEPAAQAREPLPLLALRAHMADNGDQYTQITFIGVKSLSDAFGLRAMPSSAAAAALP